MEDQKIGMTPLQEGACVFELRRLGKILPAELEAFLPLDNNGIELTKVGPVMPFAYAKATPGCPSGLHIPVQSLRPTLQLIPALYGRNKESSQEAPKRCPSCAFIGIRADKLKREQEIKTGAGKRDTLVKWQLEIGQNHLRTIAKRFMALPYIFRNPELNRATLINWSPSKP